MGAPYKSPGLHRSKQKFHKVIRNELLVTEIVLHGWPTGKTCGAKLSVYGTLTRSALWFVGQMSIAGKTISARPLIILCIKLKKRTEPIIKLVFNK